MLSDKQREIGEIDNTYGGLRVKEENGIYFWSIEDYCTSKWKRISQSLYDELMKHQDNIDKSYEIKYPGENDCGKATPGTRYDGKLC